MLGITYLLGFAYKQNNSIVSEIIKLMFLICVIKGPLVLGAEEVYVKLYRKLHSSLKTGFSLDQITRITDHLV